MDLYKVSNQLKRLALVSIHAAGSGHPGGALSCSDLVGYVTTNLMHNFNVDESNIHRNRFILSKGHACPILYAAAVIHQLIEPQMLLSLRALNSPLQGHTSNIATPWAETSTGSLAQGFSVALGIAMGNRYINSTGNVFALLGDGELQEGEVWEAAMCAAHYKLDNLVAIVDYNKMQSDDLNENIMQIEPLKDKWAAFGWRTIEIDGHNLDQIKQAFDNLDSIEKQPTVIIAHTVKGKGVGFMEESPLWHGSVKLTNDQLTQSLMQLGVDQYVIDVYLNDKVLEPGFLEN